MGQTRLRQRWEKIASVGLALLGWQIGAMLLDNRLLLVTPVVVGERLLHLCVEADFLAAVSHSVTRIFAGFFLALAAGSLLAAISGRFRFVEVLLWPVMTTIKSVPVASFIILCLIWLTSGSLSVFISFLMVVPILYTNLLQGIRSTDHKLLEMGTLFRVGWPAKLRYMYLPHLRPYLLSACSVSVGLAWKAGIAAEVIGIPTGSIGEKLYEAKVYLMTPDLFAWTVVIILVSITFEKAFLALLRQFYKRVEKA